MSLLLSIDPSLNCTGWSIISSLDNMNYKLNILDYGAISHKQSDNIKIKIMKIGQELDNILCKWQPDEAAVEEVFVNKNPMSSMKLGYACGAIMVKLTEKINCNKIYQYSATEVKKAIVGSGHATKEQVAFMIKKIFNGCNIDNKSMDISDAIAIGLCHINKSSIHKKISIISQNRN